MRPGAKEREAIHYCEALAKRADSDSVAYLTSGILLGLASAAGIVVGNTIGPDTVADATWFGKNRNSLITSASAILAVPATLLLMRSNSASTASAMAGDAMKMDSDKDAYNKCIDVRTALISSRNDVSNFAQKQIGTNNINEMKAVYDILKADYEEKKKEAEAATKDASPDAATKSKAAADAKRKLEALEEKMKAAAGTFLTP